MNEHRTVKFLVVGAGGIGTALAMQLRLRGEVTVWSRSTGVDATKEADIAEAAELLPTDLDGVFVTTGMLHDAVQRPERSMRELDADKLARSFLINTIAPALVAKHVTPRLTRDRRAVFAVLGARIGSIGDNRSGGWHGYRASKAALVMMIKTLSIELKRTHPLAICMALHPGTVDTAMSKPFQGNVTPEKLFTPEFSAKQLLAVADALVPADSGNQFDWNGTQIAP